MLQFANTFRKLQKFFTKLILGKNPSRKWLFHCSIVWLFQSIHLSGKPSGHRPALVTEQGRG